MRSNTGKKTKPKAPAHLSTESKRFWRWAAEEFVLEEHDLKLLYLVRLLPPNVSLPVSVAALRSTMPDLNWREIAFT
jgi:hypothetical protein